MLRSVREEETPVVAVNFTRGVYERYERGPVIGHGQFAIVYEARDRVTGIRYALKKIHVGTKLDSEDGISKSALREIISLQELRHENIISLVDVFLRNGQVHTIMEYMESDLSILLNSSKVIFSPAAVKCMIQMVLQGLEYIHSHGIVHRDIKPNNLLIAHDGTVKIADFGVARRICDKNENDLTPQAVLIYYRAPELCCGSRSYTDAIDMWAVACVFVELVTKAPPFQETRDFAQLQAMAEVLGNPLPEDLPSTTHSFQTPLLPLARIQTRNTAIPDVLTPSQAPLGVASLFQSHDKAVSEDTIQFLSHLFTWNPQKRASATEALRHTYFSVNPPPLAKRLLPIRPPPEDTSSAVGPSSTLKRKMSVQERGSPTQVPFLKARKLTF